MTSKDRSDTDKTEQNDKPTVKGSGNLQAHIQRINIEEHAAVAPPAESMTAMAKAIRGTTTRRDVLKAGATVAAVSAVPNAALAAMSGSPGTVANEKSRLRKKKQSPGPTERRSFLFDLSFADGKEYNMVLVQGTKHHKIRRAKKSTIRKLRNKHPVLGLVPDERLTHHIELDMPAEAVQLCYVKRYSKKGRKAGSWDMPMMFTYHPSSALQWAHRRKLGLLEEGELPRVANKWDRLGLTGQKLLELDDPVGMDVLKDANDTATAMMSGHPELMCLDSNSSAYIHDNVSGTNNSDVVGAVEFLGPAEPQQNWVNCDSPYVPNPTGYATLRPVCDPDTGQQATHSQTGDLQYIPINNDSTSNALYSDTSAAVGDAKDDTTLGGNVSTKPAPTPGLIWRSEDGVTTSAQTENSLGLNEEFNYISKDFSPGHGYSIEIESVEDNSGYENVEAIVNIRAKNWYVRYLGLYVRYLDAGGNLIPPEEIINELGEDNYNELFELSGLKFNSSSDIFVDLLAPEFEIYGMPISETDKTFEIPIPTSATSIVILGSGLGASNSSGNPFNSSVAAGATMTGVVSLGLTTFFLAMQAAEGLAPFIERLEENENFITYVPLIIELFVSTFETVGFDDPAAFLGLGVEIGEKLLGSGAAKLVQFISESIAEAEIAEDVLDSIPIFGVMYAAIAAIGTLLQLTQTASEVMSSPSTYAYEVTLTHDIEVTVRPNLAQPPEGDPNGWPATATHFEVIAHFYGGTPTSIRGELPPTQTTDPQTVTFQNVPLGGQVAMSVGVYTDSDFLVGTATTDATDNVEDVSFDITFKEILAPLDENTVYSHKEVIALDASGKHTWVATTTPPLQAASGCSPSNGQLCSLDGITVNSATGDVGQNFRSYNNAVPTCTNPNSTANAHQFSNISSTQDPESGFFFSGCTFPSSTRVTYDLLNRNSANFYLDTASRGPGFQGVIRQVRLDDDGNQGFDGPASNRAWGKLQHPSDALMLHPAGKLISISNTRNKFEVIDLPDSVRTDDTAPFSHSYSAKGLRPGLMDGPVHAALDPDGTVLVLEDRNKRIQAFDINGNAAPIFPDNNYFVPLKDQPVGKYLDLAVEFKGYIYVLSVYNAVYTLDIYEPTGEWLTATTGFDAQSLTVNYWRDVYTQNSEVLKLPNGSLPDRTEPSISHWIPSTP